MAKYDGTIRIDTSIESKGFNSGVQSMIGALKPLAAAGAALFGVTFGVKAIGAISKLSAEFHRLGIAAQVVGQMYGFTSGETRLLVKEIVGLGIQTDVANKAFINFAREGLDLSLLPALARGAQDLNVFAEAGATSSDVMDRLAHGILTLNPLILRNAGAAVDLDAAYRSFAQNAGKSANALTTMEKRQAALIAVTDKLRGVSGLYELSQQSLAGQLSSNARIMNELKAALGTPFQDALFQIVRGFNGFIKALTAALRPGGQFYGMIVNIGAALSVVGRLIGSLFGGLARLLGADVKQAGNAGQKSMGGLADSTNQAAEAQNNLAEGVKAAGKAAKGSLAAFDQLDVLQQDTADTGAGGVGAGIEDAFTALGAVDIGSIFDPLEEIRKKADELQARLAVVFEPFLSALARLKEALRPLGETIFAGLKWAYENILKPLGMWAANTLLPAVFDLLSAAVVILNDALIGLQPAGKWLWERLLKPLAEWTGDTIIRALKQVTEWLQKLHVWIGNNQEAWQIIVTVLAVVGVALLLITSPISLTTLAIGALIAAIVWLIANWKDLAKFARETWTIIQQAWFIAGWWFRTQVAEPVKNAFTTAWTSIRDGAVTAFNSVRDTIRGVINNIIDFINRMINGIVGGINSVIGALGAISRIVPGIPSLSAISAVNIPRLATGAVIPPNAQFLAMLGDQRSGRNIEAPEGLIRKIMQEELGSIKADIKIEFTGSLSELARQLRPKIDAENVRIGRSILTGGAA